MELHEHIGEIRLVLRPDGSVYQNLETGFSAKDLAAHAGPHGTYRMDGSDMQVNWADGKLSKSNYTPDKSGFWWDGGIFTPVQPITDKKSLAGTYDGGESLSRRGDWASVAKKLTLAEDGTFRLEGVAFVQSETEYAVLAAGTTRQAMALGMRRATASRSRKTEERPSVRSHSHSTTTSTPLYPDHLFIGGTLYKRLP